MKTSINFMKSAAMSVLSARPNAKRSTTFFRYASALAFLPLVALFSSCAYNRPLFTESIVSTNGTITTRNLSVRTFALWPATTQVEKQKATLGKTFSLGTTGLNEDSGGTNVVEALKAIDSILGKIK